MAAEPALGRPPAPLALAGRPTARVAAAEAGSDDWPNTSRVMPWLLAAFLVMLFITPFDSTELPMSTPVDSKLDRVMLGAIAVPWLACLLVGASGAPRLRLGAVDVALIVFVVLCFSSVALSAQTLVNLGELQLSIKKLALLLAYLMFFFLVSSVVRPREVPRFALMAVCLGAIAALGTAYEYRMGGVNPFYDWMGKLPVFDVKPPPALDKFDRPDFVGPTRHGLALTAMLVMVLPFAITSLLKERRNGVKALYGIAACLLIVGAFSTLRKTALIVPLVAVLVILLYDPRAMLRFLPLGLAMILATKFMAPGAMGQIGGLFTGSGVTSSNSTVGRTADYAAVWPDIVAHPLLGRGLGSYDPHTYRLLDNQYLGFLIEIGLIGTLAFFGIMLAATVTAHRAVRAGDPENRAPALATVSAVFVFAISGLLFDSFAFPQVTYTFLFVVALGVVASNGVRARRAAAGAPPP